jgi:hypothetical protein
VHTVTFTTTTTFFYEIRLLLLRLLLLLQLPLQKTDRFMARAQPFKDNAMQIYTCPQPALQKEELPLVESTSESDDN